MNRFCLLRRVSVILTAVFGLVCLAFTAASAQTADLGVTKEGPANIAAGTDITYSILAGNVSDVETNMTPNSTPPNTLTDTLPPGATFVSANYDTANWTCTLPSVGAAGTITCVRATVIVPGDFSSFTFVFHVDPGLTVGTTITNTASISYTGSEQSDPNPTNNSSSTTATVFVPPPPPPPPIAPHDVLISEFRLSGPNGSSDEYVELYCNRDIDCDISGGSIRSYNNGNVTGDPPGPGDISSTFPSNTIIPARHYLLVGDTSPGAYSLSGYGQININIHRDDVPDYFSDNEGLQVISPGDPTVVDSVGFIGGGEDSIFIEGTGLQRATSRPADQYAYVRKRTLATNGLPQDTDDNANDFVLVSVTGTAHPGITNPPVLGAPGPQGLGSPRSYSNSQVPASLVEPAVSKDESPNRVRVGTGDSGTLSLRRTFTNTTNQTFNYMSFRVIDITTLNSPNTLGDQAILRLVTSNNAETFTNSQNRTVVIRGTILEFDSVIQPIQANGGGLNSTVHVNLSDPETESQILIAPGESVDVQFLLNVDKAGLYRFYVYVEAAAQQQVLAPGRPSVSGSPSNMINFRRISRPTKKPKFRAPLQSTSANVVVAKPATVPSAVSNAPGVRAFIINRTPAERVKKPRKKLRVRRTTSSALKAKAEAGAKY